MMLVTVDVSGLGDEDIRDEILVNHRRERRQGRLRYHRHQFRRSPQARGQPQSKLPTRWLADFYHLLVVDNTRADYLAERFDQRTTEWKYIEAMLEMKTRAEKSKKSRIRR
jgi:hypothetical protein